MGDERRRPNRLIHEKSPYLIQHAYNPVDWFPWGAEAFAKAEAENKPVFLSLGYSTCHWCHVMERESFEDNQVAELLNQHFVSIKVDREERPDIDHVYMTVCQALTGQGGWPLTIVMTPDQKPFFAGTYFPKLSRYGRMGLMDILLQLAEKWQSDRDRVLSASQQLVSHIAPYFQSNKGELTPEALLDDAYADYVGQFDGRYGGFSGAPKFPVPHNLLFLLRYARENKNDYAISMVERTLDAMRRGGIYDHIGFGFARYSTDEKWLVPHFEKMLYDNALLCMAYLEAFQVTGNHSYRQTVEQILTYVTRDMKSPGGGFYSAEDADSEGIEGRFYVWTLEEVVSILGDEAGNRYCRYYDISVEGNFEGYSIPNLIDMNLETFAEQEQIDADNWKRDVQIYSQKLFSVREQRVHPHKDDKILTAWNGLMIAAMAKAGAVLDCPEYVERAKDAATFIDSELTSNTGRLLARYREGEARYFAYADDYAFYIWGLIELYQTTFDAEYLVRATHLQDEMLRLFWDEQDGGFFLYGSDGENLIARPKEIYDGATPSGNSVGAYNLVRLFKLTGSTKYADYANQLLGAFAGAVQDHPTSYSFYLMALQMAYGQTKEIVIAGGEDDESTKQALRMVRSLYLPEAVVIYHPSGASGQNIESIAEYVKDQTAVDGQTTVYVCENFSCQAPRTDWKTVLRSLQ